MAAAAALLLAPPWDSVTYDGDFDYLPPAMPSVTGGRLLDQAFPEERSRSEIVIVIARSDGPLHESDEYVAMDLQRRLYHRWAEVSLAKAVRLGWDGQSPPQDPRQQQLLQRASEALNEAIEADERFYEAFIECVPETPPNLTEPRMAIAYWDRAQLRSALGDDQQATADREAAYSLVPDIDRYVRPLAQRQLEPWHSLLDVLSWQDPVIGHRLTRGGARLIILRLESELAAVENIATVESLQQLIDDVKAYSGRCTEPGLQILPTGSAAVGGQTLAASRDAIRYTEIFTVLMILMILAAVYRAPLLVLIPVVSIGVAVVTATGMVAALADYSRVSGGQWLDLRVFTTSKIFVVVILFGAGTDYCLFLIARLREEAAKRPWREACQVSLSRVTSALVGSALTTVVGLGMLWIASFGKFHYTGPVIAICLLVGLAVCMTLTPALLYAAGPAVFWPSRPQPEAGVRGPSGVWGRIALVMTRRPWLTLLAGVGALLAPAVYGYVGEQSVTYDISSQLSPDASSRRGVQLLAQHFPIGESNPTTVLLVRPEPVSREQMAEDVRQLRAGLYDLPGVEAVRTASDPLGDYPPEVRMGLLDKTAWRRRILQQHRVAQRYFHSDAPDFVGRLARLDVVVQGDPFGPETAAHVADVRRWTVAQTQRPGSAWAGSEVAVAGITASIIDLRQVTLQDNRRIKWAVVLAVFTVLVVVLRRFWLSLYLIATVLLSYYATLGLTVLFFRALYGDTYVGLDWKLPLFLFVILVAVGQDYNVYLVTRVLEEQRRGGWLSALRRAVARTGGIITSCGLVMAGTFFSMTASAWYPPLAQAIGLPAASSGATLRGIVELGFALGLGVLIDTFYVRTILVPAFIALFDRFQRRGLVSLAGSIRGGGK